MLLKVIVANTNTNCSNANHNHIATLYASVSASFVIEQEGLPILSTEGFWNNDSPHRRLELMRRQM